MNTETLVFVILCGVVLTAFLIPKLWSARNPNPLAARLRGLGVLVCVLALVLAIATITRFALPAAAPSVILICLLACELMFAIFYRQRLARRAAAKA